MLGAFLLSVIVNYFYFCAYDMKYQLPRNFLPLPGIAQRYELVSLGNSHSQEGLTFKKYNLKSLPLSSVAQSFEYDYALLRMNANQIKKNAIIIIVVSPISFSQNIPKDDDIVNTQYYDGRLSPFLIPHFKPSEYMQIEIAPFTRAGYLLRQQYSKKAEETAFQTFATQWKTPPPVIVEPPPPNRNSNPTFNVQQIQVELNAPPATSDAQFMGSVRFMTNKWYNSGGFSVDSFDANRKDLEKIVNYSLEHNWRPVLVTLPISQALLNNLGPGFLKKYIYDNVKKTNLKGLDYFNFADDTRITQDKYLYSNSDHLNPKGAAIMSYLLLQKLIQKGYLPKSADGYDYSNH